jgi:filamentous hemagglutinin family protein
MSNRNFARELRNGASVAALALGLSSTAYAGGLPTHGHYVSGDGSIGKANRSLTVKQSSTTGIIDWKGFSVGAKNGVTFDNGSGATLNRVTGGNLSRIAGSLHATGSLYLMNSSGVIVSGTGRIMTGGNFVATSGNITNGAFGADDTRLRAGKAAVISRGTITAGGSAILTGRDVGNTGTIKASQVDLQANRRLAIGGKVIAQTANGAGGTVTARALVIDVSGHIVTSATKAENSGGTVSVVARDLTIVSGTIAADGGKGGTGGFIETSGAHLHVADSAKISTLATNGHAGTWLIDPQDFTIASFGGDITGAELSSELAGGNVVIQSSSGAKSGSGDIFVDDAVSWSTASTLTLDAYHDIAVNAPVTISGAGGLRLTTNDGGSGGILAVNLPVSFTSTGTLGALTINGTQYTLENNFATLISNLNASPSGHYALATSLNAGGTTYAGSPITTTFTGTFEGLGNTIYNLTISDPSTTSETGTGLFKTVNTPAVIADLNLANVNITRTASYGYVGGLVGANGNQVSGGTGGTLRNDMTSGSVSSLPGNDIGGTAGGLVGDNAGGSILNSSSSATVTVDYGSNAGGLVGAMDGGNITNSFATGNVTETGSTTSEYAAVGGLAGITIGGTINNSYAAGVVYGSAGNLGGFIGQDNSTAVLMSYATGAVTGVGTPYLAGFIGDNEGGTVSQSYATGNVSGSGAKYGLIAYNTGTVSDSVWDKTSTGQDIGVDEAGGTATNVTGVTSSNAYTASTYTALGWTFDTTPGNSAAWVLVDADGSLNNASGAAGGTRPMLLSEYSNAIRNVHQLQLMELDPTAHYTLASNVDAVGTSGGDVWNSQGFIAVGGNSASSNFTGTFDGQGHTISNIAIDSSADEALAGLFGDINSGAVSDLHLIGLNITASGSLASAGGLAGKTTGATIVGVTTAGSVSIPGTSGTAGGVVGSVNSSAITNSSSTATISADVDASDAGGFAGYDGSSTLSNDSASGSVTVGNSSSGVGGFVGEVEGGTVQSSFATGAVNAGSNTEIAGGFAGYIGSGTVETSYATGQVTVTSGASALDGVGGFVGWVGGGIVKTSYATGAVNGGSSTKVGGFAGDNASTIKQSYSMGAVSAANSSFVGGFVGNNQSGATIDQSYSLGIVTGGTSTATGGFVGRDQSTGGITNSYWDTQTSGTTSDNNGSGSGAVGLTTAQLQSSLASLGFDSSVWGEVAGSFPYLLSQFANGVTPTPISGTIGTPTSGVNVGLYSYGTEIALSTYADGSFYQLDASLPQSGLAVVYDNSVVFEDTGGNLAGLNLGTASLTAFTSDASLSALGNALSAALGTGSPLGTITSVQDLATETGGNVSITTSGAFDFDQSLSIGSNTLSLFGGGAITQSNGVLTASTLTGGSSGAVTLNGSNQIADLGAFSIGDGAFALTDARDLTVSGAVGGGAGDLSLTTTGSGNAISVQNTLTTTGTATLTSADAISESGSGAISAGTLTGSSSGTVTLNGSNQIADLGAFTTSGGAFALTDTAGLTVTGAVDSGAGDLNLTTTGTGNGISIQNTLTTTGTATLTSADVISESGSGAISAGTLTGSSSGDATLNGSNQITNLGAFTTGGGAFALTDAAGLTVTAAIDNGAGDLSLTTTGIGNGISIQNTLTTTGMLTLDSSGDVTQTAAIAADSLMLGGDSVTLTNSGNHFNSLSGTVNTASVFDDSSMTVSDLSASGDVALTTADGFDLILDGDVSVGSSTLTLNAGGADGGTITQSSGIITAGALTGAAHGAVTLNGANAITGLGAFTTGGNNAFSLTNAADLTVNGAVNAGTAGLMLTTTGTGHAITLDDALTGGTVTLTSADFISESGSGAIDAASLTGASTGATTLSGANVITDLGTFMSGSTFALTDDHDLTVDGTVNAGAHTVELTTTGSGHDIAIDAKVEGGTVDLVSAATITENSSGDIDATKLGGSSAGTAEMNSAKNTITDLGTFTAGSTFELTDDHNLTVDGTVKASGHTVELTTKGSGHDINLDAKIEATELKLASAATIAENSSGDIDVTELTGSSAGSAEMNSATNTVTDLGAFTSGSALELTDDHDLTVEGTARATGHTVELTTNGSGHDINLDAEIDAKELKLVSAATITESKAGDIDVTELTGSSKSGVTMTSAKNAIADLAAFASGGAFALTDDNALKVDGTVNAGSHTLDLTTIGENHNLAIDAEIEGGTIDLVTTGEATESSAGAIDTKLLNVTADTGIDLTSKKNDITKLGTHKTNKGPNKVTL